VGLGTAWRFSLVSVFVGVAELCFVDAISGFIRFSL